MGGNNIQIKLERINLEVRQPYGRGYGLSNQILRQKFARCTLQFKVEGCDDFGRRNNIGTARLHPAGATRLMQGIEPRFLGFTTGENIGELLRGKQAPLLEQTRTVLKG